MNIKKILCLFVVVASYVVCSCYELAFADEKAKSGMAMKVCRGINSLKTTKKIVALTFDDGPHKKYTTEILNILKQNNVRATFFVIGKNAQRYPEIIKETYLNGNIIGNHTYSHYFLTSLPDDEIEGELIKTKEIIHSIIGVYPTLFRPPYGACSSRSIRIVGELGLITIGWSDATNDYDAEQTTSEKIAGEIIKYAKSGAIIGMHDGGGNREKTVNALPIVIRALRAEGYEFLTIPELLNINAYMIPQNVS